jgi:hypothetical protein
MLSSGLQAHAERLGARTHAVDFAGHRARIGQQGFTGFGQGRLARTAVEQGDIQLLLEVGNGVADDRLGAVQGARRMGEAAMVDDRDKDAQLVESGKAGISHIKKIDNFYRYKTYFIDNKPVLRWPQSPTFLEQVHGKRSLYQQQCA